jgi:hypothetical protein
MSVNRESLVNLKEERRAPSVDKPSFGSRLKKKLAKKDRGDFKIRVTTRDSQWIWNQYRNEDIARGALRTQGTKYKFYFLEVLNGVGEVIADNREEHDAYLAREAAFRSQGGI